MAAAGWEEDLEAAREVRPERPVEVAAMEASVVVVRVEGWVVTAAAADRTSLHGRNPRNLSRVRSH